MNNRVLLVLTIMLMWLLVSGACSLFLIFIITWLRDLRK